MVARPSRLNDLLSNAVKCFREMRNPFDISELVAHNVTLDETYDLSISIARAIEFYLNHKTQATDEAMVDITKDVLGPDAAAYASAKIKFNRALKALPQYTK